MNLSPSYVVKESRLFQGKNFMTPEILGFGKIGDKYVYEVSQGPAPFESGKHIFGLTVKDIKTFETSNYSGAYESLNEIEDVILSIKEKEGIL